MVEPCPAGKRLCAAHRTATMVLMYLRSTILDLGFLIVGGIILYAIASIPLTPERFFLERDPSLSYPYLANETVNTVSGGGGSV